MNTTRKNHVDFPIAVTASEATTLLFHHLALAAVFFEASPLQPEILAAFDEKYPDQDILGVKTQREFLVSLNREYIEAFDDEAEAEAERAEGE